MKRLAYVSIVVMMAATAHAADPFAGTWKLNVARSKGPNVAKELTTVATEKGDVMEVVVKGTARDGMPISLRYTIPLKGGVIKYTEGGPAGVTVNAKIIDAATRESTWTRDGKTIGTSQLVLSKDGRTITATNNFVDPKGQPMNGVEVYERQ